LFAALNTNPYSLPSTVPSSFQTGANCASITDSVPGSIGTSDPARASVRTSAGWAMPATSGGDPPASRVESTVGTSSPPDT
jgi:hypothetical protein